MNELQENVDTIFAMDEPETILPTIRRAAERKKGKRWQTLAIVLGEAEIRLDQLLNAKPAGPDFTQPNDEQLKDFANRGRAAQQAVNELGAGKPVNTDAEAKPE